MTALRVAFHTLGCKLNQLETESLADSFVASGASIVPFSGEAELYVVNTCTVTGKAEQKARRLIRQALGVSRPSVVLVTGCYAQVDAPALAALGDRVLVIPGDEKQTIPALAAYLAEHWQMHGDLFETILEWRQSRVAEAYGAACPDRFVYRPETFTYHSRPSLKIQDGCDNRCSYCRVCIARGPSVSIAPDEALRRIRRLEDAGRAEVVLTGVNLSQYRFSAAPASVPAALEGGGGGEVAPVFSRASGFGPFLSFLLQNTSSIAFRISSFEPDRIDDDFLGAFADPRVRPHVHLAMQSGSDPVLRRMRRKYDANKIAESVARLRAVRDDPFIAADIIAGFPGETEAEFESTLELCRILDLAWIHAFPFSPRPGTDAFSMRPMIPERVTGERVRALTSLAYSGHAAYIDRWTGSSVDAILERVDESGIRQGTTENYLKVRISGLPENMPAGRQVRIVIEGRSDRYPSSDPSDPAGHSDHADLSADALYDESRQIDSQKADIGRLRLKSDDSSLSL